MTMLTAFPITAEERVSASYCSAMVWREVTGRLVSLVGASSFRRAFGHGSQGVDDGHYRVSMSVQLYDVSRRRDRKNWIIALQINGGPHGQDIISGSEGFRVEAALQNVRFLGNAVQRNAVQAKDDGGCFPVFERRAKFLCAGGIVGFPISQRLLSVKAFEIFQRGVVDLPVGLSGIEMPGCFQSLLFSSSCTSAAFRVVEAGS